MIKTFTINGDIDQELMHEMSEFYNGLAEGDKVVVMLCSDGGSSHSRDAIIAMLSIYEPITCLIGYGCLASAAFELFFSFRGERHLAGHCSGMYHRAYASYIHDSSGKIKDAGDRFSFNMIKTQHWEYAKSLFEATGMSAKDIKKISRGEDVYFNAATMQQFLDFNTKLVALEDEEDRTEKAVEEISENSEETLGDSNN